MLRCVECMMPEDQCDCDVLLADDLEPLPARDLDVLDEMRDWGPED